MKAGRKENTHLDIKRRIEPHLQLSLVILIEHAEETLFEYRSCKRIRQDDDSIRRVRQGSHFQQTDLVQAARKQVYNVAVVRYPLCQSFIKLLPTQSALSVGCKDVN